MTSVPATQPSPTMPAPSSALPGNWRDRFLRPMLYGALGLGLVALVFGLLTNQGAAQNAVFICAYVIVLAATVVRVPNWARVGALMLAVYALGLNELLSTGILGDASMFFLALVVFGALLLSWRAGAAAVAVALVTFLVAASMMSVGRLTLMSPGAMQAGLADWLSTSVTFVLFAGVLIAGMRLLERDYVESQNRGIEMLQTLQQERVALESRVEVRTQQLTAVNEVGRVVTSILDPQELAGQVANLITENFGYYYAALFLVDESGEDAKLFSATGEAGRILKETGHHLRVGGNSMVGSAISTGKPRVALDVGAEKVRFQNPLLPYTRSEIAIPLTVGQRVLGALDVQSTKAGAFGPQEVETLQAMASQVATALDNARLFQEAQKSLDELQAIQRQYALDAWTPYAAGEGLDYRVGDHEPSEAAARLEVPLALREQVIGKIDLAGDAEWTPEQRSLVETIATQAALALENARLVEETQAAAQREHQLADITSKIWTASTLDTILQTAVRELGEALDSSSATIELKMEAGNE